MKIEERKEYVRSLVADFQAAVAEGSQDVAVWMNLALRYHRIGANMSVAYCVRKARECPVAVEELRYEPVEAVA